ncbi:MAG: hypothetical protein ACI9OD_002436 [Limisphaerales bacterium]|jgi:hypothetical protein
MRSRRPLWSACTIRMSCVNPRYLRCSTSVFAKLRRDKSAWQSRNQGYDRGMETKELLRQVSRNSHVSIPWSVPGTSKSCPASKTFSDCGTEGSAHHSFAPIPLPRLKAVADENLDDKKMIFLPNQDSKHYEMTVGFQLLARLIPTVQTNVILLYADRPLSEVRGATNWRGDSSDSSVRLRSLRRWRATACPRG